MNHCCHVTCQGFFSCKYSAEPALAPWERALLGHDRHPEGYGEVTFYRFDGKTVTVDNVRVDSIGPDSDTANREGVCADLLNDERILHVPSVSHWTIEYRY